MLIRKTNPGLYRTLMRLAVMSILLGFNFFFYTPTFNPIPKTIVGVIFTTLGIALFVSVNWIHKGWRHVLAVSMGATFFWAIINTQQVFEGKASFQLPIFLLGFSVAHFFALIEPPVNPMTRRE